MTDLSFRIEPEVIIGADVLTRAGTTCKAYGTRALIITEHGLVKRGLVERLAALLADVGIETILFDTVDDHSTVDLATSAANLARGARASVIIGFGGLTTQMIARLTAITTHSSLELFELLDGKDPNNASMDAVVHTHTQDDFLPYIAILTEADTFMFSRAFIAVDSRDRSVKLIKAPKGLCVALLLDSLLMADATTHPVSMFDSLCVALEAYCSKSANFLSDILLEQAISYYARLLPASASETSSAATDEDEDDDEEDEEASGTDSSSAQDAALLTALGVALSAPGIATALSYAIHARFPVEKARCSAILLPRIAEKLVSVRPEKVAKVAALFGETIEGLSVAEAANMTITVISQRLTEWSAPTALRELNLSLDRLISVAETARNLEFIAYSPWTITSEEVFELLKQSF
jgi:alcohol dehydrogenase